MGHVVFVVLHIVAALFGFVWLVLTIPLHLIYGAVVSRSGPAAAPQRSTVACPECKEEVLAVALKCKHCGAALTPVNDIVEADKVRQVQQANAAKARLIVFGPIAAIAVVAFVAWSMRR